MGRKKQAGGDAGFPGVVAGGGLGNEESGRGLPQSKTTSVVREFRYGSELWRVARFDLFEAEFGAVAPERVVTALMGSAEALAGKGSGLGAAGHSPAVRGNARSWLIVRRLFGIGPVLPPLDADPEDLRVWSRAELMDLFGVTAEHLRLELEAVRGAIGMAANALDARERSDAPRSGGVGLNPNPNLSGSPSEKRQGASSSAGTTADRGAVQGASDARGSGDLFGEGPQGLRRSESELNFQEEAVLREFNFPERMFVLPARDPDENRVEKTRFAKRVEEFRKILEHTVAKSLGRQALMNELQLWRMETTLCSHEIGSEIYARTSKLMQSTEASYQRQLEQIDELAPYLGAIAGKLAFKGLVSELTEAIIEYRKNQSRRLVDGIFTMAEIEVELRQSAQMPEPRYRAGLVAALNAARSGFWDVHWKPTLTGKDLRKVDAAFKASIVAAGLEAGEELPDLEGDGEYEELVGAVVNEQG